MGQITAGEEVHYGFLFCDSPEMVRGIKREVKDQFGKERDCKAKTVNGLDLNKLPALLVYYLWSLLLKTNKGFSIFAFVA